MIRQRGFIALYALLSLALLLGLAVLALAHWDGLVQRERRLGAEAASQRIAYGFIQEQLLSEMEATPRPWVPALAGEGLYEGTKIMWRRIPIDGRWRAGARPWTPDFLDAMERLGADKNSLMQWNGWLQSRQSSLNPQVVGRSDLITDPRYLGSLFESTGLARAWGTPERLWTIDPDGSLGRLNLFGADPRVVSALAGIPESRVQAFQSLADKGELDPSSAIGYWRFDEWQALSRWFYVRPFSEEQWEVTVWYPGVRDPSLTRWRISRDDGTPGNPWFRIQSWSLDQW